MITIRKLSNGQTIARDDDNRVWMLRGDQVLGQIQPGDMASQLLGLTIEDFGAKPPPPSSPAVTAGPQPPKRAPWFGVGVREWLRRQKK